MQLTRTLNVITMACLLFLTGCFGITGDTITPEADGQNTTTGNNLSVGGGSPSLHDLSTAPDSIYVA